MSASTRTGPAALLGATNDSSAGLSSADYFAAMARPADVSFTPAELLALQAQGGGQQRVFQVLEREGQPAAWAVAELLSGPECDEVVRLGEEAGMETPMPFNTYRTAKRTSQYQNQELAERVASRLPQELKDKMAAADGLDVQGVHENWRVVRYDAGDSFPAHYDQWDNTREMQADGSKRIYFSSHTLLINLTAHGVEGGATRFYPRATRRDPYSYAVDVSLPQGWGLVFLQKGLLHAGQPVLSGCKHIAQAGVMRFLPPGRTLNPSTFAFGPGLQENLGERYDPEAVQKWQATRELQATGA